MLILVTGATGKVGRHFIAGLLDDPRFSKARIRALCHNRLCAETDRTEVMRGSIADRDVVDRALSGVTHVVHLATCKETPDSVMDVTVKGLFWLLEAFRVSTTARQFILIGGDAGIGHFYHRHAGPLTEATPHRAYPGCYALTKVIEEVMLEQYGIQYGINGCCLRAPWIVEKDDFRYALSFTNQFGGPAWSDLMSAQDVARHARSNSVPLLRDVQGAPLRRNFIHVEDLVTALLAALDNPAASGQLFNIAMDEPVDYGELARYLHETRSLPAAEIRTSLHSNWLDNAKARLRLGWKPQVDLHQLVERAWTYVRAPDDPRIIWYPG